MVWCTALFFLRAVPTYNGSFAYHQHDGISYLALMQGRGIVAPAESGRVQSLLSKATKKLAQNGSPIRWARCCTSLSSPTPWV
jgi:hypothetical protein